MKATHLTMESNAKEFLWCKINLTEQNNFFFFFFFFFLCIYRSPTSTIENLLDLNRMLKSTSDLRFSHLLIVGDFNFKEINWSLFESSENESHMAFIFLEGIKDCFLFQQIREPARFREGQIPNSSDLIFTNEENMVDKINHLRSLGKVIMSCFVLTSLALPKNQ